MHPIKARCRSLGVAIFFVSILALGQDVHYNFMPGTNFGKYHTYKWVEIAGSPQLNQIQDAEVKQAVDSQLAAKGFTKTTDEKADMYIGYQTAVDKEKQWDAYGMGRGWGGGMANATSSTIAVGTLALDFYDPAEKQLIWRGEATKTLNPSGNQEKNMKNLDKAMEKLLKNFPPKQ
jgi:hypothetical protein